jgi:hypothetical protein
MSLTIGTRAQSDHRPAPDAQSSRRGGPTRNPGPTRQPRSCHREWRKLILARRGCAGQGGRFSSPTNRFGGVERPPRAEVGSDADVGQAAARGHGSLLSESTERTKLEFAWLGVSFALHPVEAEGARPFLRAEGTKAIAQLIAGQHSSLSIGDATTPRT